MTITCTKPHDCRHSLPPSGHVSHCPDHTERKHHILQPVTCDDVFSPTSTIIHAGPSGQPQEYFFFRLSVHMSLAPGNKAIPMKKARYAEEAVYEPSFVHFQTNMTDIVGCRTIYVVHQLPLECCLNVFTEHCCRQCSRNIWTQRH